MVGFSGARIVGVGNQKGGVGKTTNTVHIARALVELGRKVLIIDLDMNHGATRHFGVEPEAFLGSFEMPGGPVVHIQIDDEHLPAQLDQCPCDVNGIGGFTHPSFLITHSNNARP